MMMLSFRQLLAGFLLCVSLADAAFPKPRTAPSLPVLSTIAKEHHQQIPRGREDNPLMAKLRALQQISGGAVDDGVAKIDKTDTWNVSDMEALDFVYLVIHGALLVAVVLFCRNVAHSGGRAPSWITGIMPDPYATIFMHLVFFGLGLLLPLVLPPGLSRLVFSSASVALLGFIFPAVESVRAALSDDSGADDWMWLMFWVIQGIFQYSTELWTSWP
jgi:hypothetical protein